MKGARRDWRSSLIDLAMVLVITNAALIIVLRLWDADISVPFVYGNDTRQPLTYAPDAPFYLEAVQAMLRGGSHWTNALLGAPYGSNLYDIPQGGDNLQWALMWLLGRLRGDAAFVVNTYFLLTFDLIAASAWLVLRRLGAARSTSLVFAILYAFLPYHFARSTAHLLLSGYFMVPFGVLIAVAVGTGRGPFTADADNERHWRWRFGDRRSLGYLFIAIALGSTGPYYAFLSVVLICLIAVLCAVSERTWRPIASALIVAGLVGTTVMVNLSPSLLYWHDHGRPTQVLARGFGESENNSLKLSLLVAPVAGHRVVPLARLAEKFENTPVRTETGQNLGLLGSIGLVIVGGSVLLSATRRRVATDDTTRLLGLLCIMSLLIGSVGGVDLLLATIGPLREFRSWNRLSVFIAFASFGALALAIDAVLARLVQRSGRSNGRTVAALVAAALLVVGLCDQVSTRVVPCYSCLETHWRSDRVYFRHVESTLASEAMVFNLPYNFFPESGTIWTMGPYDQGLGTLHSHTLRWSFGATRGRPEDFGDRVGKLPPSELLPRLVANGFTGISLDTFGYDDEGLAYRYAFDQAIGYYPTFTSPDERYLFYDLRPFAADLERRLGSDAIVALREHR